MHFTSLVALLPALALAQEQVPLADRVQGWFNKAKSLVPTAVPVDPIVKLSEKVTEKSVTPLTLSNWESILTPGLEPEDWLIFVTGGNKTCFGRCEHATKAFNESTLLFAADPTSPNLGYMDCEENRVLCSIWSAGAPSIYYFEKPVTQSEGRAPTPLHIIYLNATTITPKEIYEIHSKKTFQETEPYEGAMHPTDSWLAQNKLNTPIGYALYAIGAVPSWMFMIGISFFSRTFMGRRMGNVGAQQRPAAAPAGSAN
ncbi:hypothetical protein N7478_007821 [Penicillium angulare]|uniref:uncharacterized protein n=1 Tax=Penicillium angulare TaxID=116970 RepID=UPI0025408A0F|nr:uncharacterized protein N7478_007821 [Penicillium angulare]KAJ5272696.1 hypothetical protein N7478_007821 [Penicillium angulare]